jgi:pimeloyl-ACP methyl ester carboxylesterase
MGVFVLVHGAWHGGWCYQRVARHLRAKGHDVFTPTLTGLGERSHLLTDTIELDTHIQDILNVIRWEDLDDFVLCGHSYGGMVVTGVADAIPAKLSSLVYLDAYVPRDGESIWDYLSDQRRDTILKDAAPLGGSAVLPPPVEHFGVSERDRDWVRAKLTPQPMRTLRQAIRLKGGYGPLRRRVYVYATGPSSMEGHYQELHDDPAWTFHVTACGHEQMLDEPEEIAAVLLAAAQQSMP